MRSISFEIFIPFNFLVTSSILLRTAPAKSFVVGGARVGGGGIPYAAEADRARSDILLIYFGCRSRVKGGGGS